ncbi:MAG: HAD-IC family P-type ATPase, partial [Armatimonadota bacterium]
AAALPEALPAAATINFALGVRNMRQHQVLVRRLQAIETIGATGTVCLDKTGTLTCNRMSIAAIGLAGTRIAVTDGRCVMHGDPLDQPVLHRLLDVCCLCSDVAIRTDGAGGVELDGSSTETALIRLARNAGVDVVRLRAAYPLVCVENRAENRLYMTTIHQAPDGGRLFYAVKGSPDKVLAMCRYRMEAAGPVPFSPERQRAVERENHRMAGEAMRVIGVACATAEGSDFRAERDLVWLGLVGMVDPIRESAPDLMRVFHRAGIETIMITGDQRPTAEAVARQLGLSKNDAPVILDAAQLVDMEEDALAKQAVGVDVYSRVSPRNKLDIVQALQSAGKVVAMTGDGINDSPALKAADIGIAMGRSGTEVAREVADIVLQEDNLEALILAVRDGRTTYDNIRKTLRFLLATNMSEIAVMLVAMAAGIGQPLTVVQLLWINLISDVFPGLCLCMEGPEGDVLVRHIRIDAGDDLDEREALRDAVGGELVEPVGPRESLREAHPPRVAVPEEGGSVGELE